MEFQKNTSISITSEEGGVDANSSVKKRDWNINTSLPISTGMTSVGTMLACEQRSLFSHLCNSRLQCCIKERFSLVSNHIE